MSLKIRCPIAYCLVNVKDYVDHVKKCNIKNSHLNLVQCPYSIKHFMPKEAMNEHLKHCSVFSSLPLATIMHLWQNVSNTTADELLLLPTGLRMGLETMAGEKR